MTIRFATKIYCCNQFEYFMFEFFKTKFPAIVSLSSRLDESFVILIEYVTIYSTFGHFGN